MMYVLYIIHKYYSKSKRYIPININMQTTRLSIDMKLCVIWFQ